jgi:hypothetical protein
MKRPLALATTLAVATTDTLLYQPTQAQPLPPLPQNCTYLREITTG